jgi:porin
VKRPQMLLMILLLAGCCLGQSAGDSEKGGLPTRILQGPKRGRSWLDERGLLGQLTFVNDWSCDIRGGAEPGRCFNRYALDVMVGIDAEKAVGWKGSSGFVRLKHYLGEHGGQYVGDAQGFSNIDSPAKSYLYELWGQQTLWKNRLRVKAGKVDANSEFASVRVAADFLNSSMGYSPTIMLFPTYPEPRPGALGFLYGGHYQLGTGLFRRCRKTTCSS